MFLPFLFWYVYIVRTIYSCVQVLHNFIVRTLYNILYYVLVPICVHSICIILLLWQKYSASLQHRHNWFQTPLHISRCPSRANIGAPVTETMVGLQRGTIKIRPRFWRLVWSRRRGPGRRKGWNFQGGGKRGSPSGQPLCWSLLYRQHFRRWRDNSGGSVGRRSKIIQIECTQIGTNT